jgi:hypothetical protein
VFVCVELKGSSYTADEKKREENVSSLPMFHSLLPSSTTFFVFLFCFFSFVFIDIQGKENLMLFCLLARLKWAYATRQVIVIHTFLLHLFFFFFYFDCFPFPRCTSDFHFDLSINLCIKQQWAERTIYMEQRHQLILSIKHWSNLFQIRQDGSWWHELWTEDSPFHNCCVQHCLSSTF